MAVKLTQAAAQHVKKMLAQQEQAIGLRVATKQSGCSGFAYEIDYADAIAEKDVAFKSFGVTVVVDQNSLLHLDGTVIDFVRQNALNQGFEFNNPNVKNQCGCGESFNV